MNYNLIHEYNEYKEMCLSIILILDLAMIGDCGVIW